MSDSGYSESDCQEADCVVQAIITSDNRRHVLKWGIIKHMKLFHVSGFPDSDCVYQISDYHSTFTVNSFEFIFIKRWIEYHAGFRETLVSGDDYVDYLSFDDNLFQLVKFDIHKLRNILNVAYFLSVPQQFIALCNFHIAELLSNTETAEIIETVSSLEQQDSEYDDFCNQLLIEEPPKEDNFYADRINLYWFPGCCDGAILNEEDDERQT
jgi:hypothetical protein